MTFHWMRIVVLLGGVSVLAIAAYGLHLFAEWADSLSNRMQDLIHYGVMAFLIGTLFGIIGFAPS